MRFCQIDGSNWLPLLQLVLLSLICGSGQANRTAAFVQLVFAFKVLKRKTNLKEIKVPNKVDFLLAVGMINLNTELTLRINS